LGTKKALALSTVLHVFTAAFVVSAGILGAFGLFFWVGAAIFLSLLVYQHSIVKHDDLSRVNLAFGTTNGIASVAFATCFLVDYFMH
jgi:4-hydroxybenzoate polyprenyltransferase